MLVRVCDVEGCNRTARVSEQPGPEIMPAGWHCIVEQRPAEMDSENPALSFAKTLGLPPLPAIMIPHRYFVCEAHPVPKCKELPRTVIVPPEHDAPTDEVSLLSDEEIERLHREHCETST